MNGESILLLTVIRGCQGAEYERGPGFDLTEQQQAFFFLNSSSWNLVLSPKTTQYASRRTMASLRVFVNDSLHSILGYTEGSLVDYVIALAKKTKDVPSLVRALHEQDFPAAPQTQLFAAQLFQKIPRETPAAAPVVSIIFHPVRY